MKKLILVCMAVAIMGLFVAVRSKHRSSNYVTYLRSASPPVKYCNGDVMNSKGYRQTIQLLHTTKIPLKGLSRQQLVNKTIELASGDNNPVVRSFKQSGQALIKLRAHTAYVAPIDGWPGISIFMCSWRPLVEVNLQHISFVKHVVWQ